MRVYLKKKNGYCVSTKRRIHDGEELIEIHEIYYIYLYIAGEKR